MSKNQAHKLQNGSPGEPRSTNKAIKMRSGMESGKNCTKYWKMEALEPWKSWFSWKRLLKMLLPPCCKKRDKWGRKCVQNGIQIYKRPFWEQWRKENKKRATNNTNCTKKHHPRMSHESVFRILKRSLYLHGSSLFVFFYFLCSYDNSLIN